MAEIITNNECYIVMIGSVAHPVNKATKLCGCGMPCNAVALLEDYFSKRRQHRCPICDAVTTRHPTLYMGWICPTDATHYWKNRLDLLRRRWGEPAKKPSQVTVVETATLQAEMPVVPEARKLPS